VVGLLVCAVVGSTVLAVLLFLTHPFSPTSAGQHGPSIVEFPVPTA
jgi:hypothetical protein